MEQKHIDGSIPWWPYKHWSPILICWVELTDGRQMIAVFVGDEWETMDGRVVVGVKQWSPLRIGAVRGIYE